MTIRVRRGVSYAVIAASLIAPWEGLALTAKPDRLAHGLPTACYGMTPYDRPVTVGEKFTPQQCMDYLIADIPKYKTGLDRCIHIPVQGHQHQWAAAISLGYNVGDAAVCRSTFVRGLNAGDPKACDSLLAFDRASGRVVQGLENRRQAERKVCYTKD